VHCTKSILKAAHKSSEIKAALLLLHKSSVFFKKAALFLSKAANKSGIKSGIKICK
jgi:hypothetical protein